MRQFTAADDTELHASIAGGRKTMGYYLGYALSLFGRPQDRLSHVLVSEPFEATWEFFYPTPYSHIIEVRDRGLVDTAEARVSLAEIPFVSLRHGLPKGLLDGEVGFADAVRAATAGIGRPSLVIDYGGRRLLAGGRQIALPPRELAFIGWFARRLLDGVPPPPCPLQEHPEPAFGAEYLREYRAVVGAMGDDERTAARLADGMDGAFFSEVKSCVNRRLRNALGLARHHYQISELPAPAPTRGPRRYGLRLVPGDVRFAGGGAGASLQPALPRTVRQPADTAEPV